ncbi:MAG: hypothetical protein ABMA00_07850 [Gemmatimonas sp.]
MSPRKPATMDQLWQEPRDLAQRDLLGGEFGRDQAPNARDEFQVTGKKTSGTQSGYDVKDGKGREWSVKLGVEARVEVVVSRIVWAIGYHQPPVYYLPKWTRVEDGAAVSEEPARFRLEPKSLKKTGEWSWTDNPFVGTQPLAGLFTVMVLFSNWDLKAAQNATYQMETAGRSPETWYLVRDLGASLGKTAWLDRASKADTAAFIAEGFITRVEGNRVRFDYNGSWLEPRVHDIVTPADVRWVCGLLARLSLAQWHDAFRAGGFTDAEADAYIKRLREKIAEGQRLGWS